MSITLDETVWDEPAAAPPPSAEAPDPRDLWSQAPDVELDARAIPADRRVGRWPWYLAGVLFVQYSLVGVWLVKVRGYMIFDALNRTITAQILVLSRDPHLGAMGFYWPPLPMFVRVPFVLILAPFGETILSGPLSTALTAALVVPVLAKIGREVGASTSVTAIVIGIYALNPVTVFSAANGMSEAMFFLCLALVLLGLIRFSNTRHVRDLAITGMGLATGMASRYEFLVLTVAVAVAVAILSDRHRRRPAIYLVAIPPAFVFALWTLASSLIAKDPFYWYHASRVSGMTPVDHPWMPADLTPINIVGYTVGMVLLVAPTLVVVGFAGALQRFGRRGWLAVVLVSGALPAFLAMQLQARASYGTPRYFAMMPLFGAIGGLWIVGRAAQQRRAMAANVLAALVVVTSIVGAVAATYAYTDFDRTRIERESVFFDSVVGRPAPDYDPYLDRLSPLMAELERRLDAGGVVAMDSLIAAPVLLSRHPDRFIVPEDRDFEAIMSDPTGRFDLVVEMTAGLAPSSYGLAIKTAMNGVEGGSFVLVGDYGVAKLWAFRTDVELAADAAAAAAQAPTTTVGG